jgi:hypothetical protein
MANKRLAKKRAKQEAAKAVEVKVEAPVVEEAVVETETPVVEEVKEEAVVVEEVPAVEEVKVEVETAPTPVAEETAAAEEPVVVEEAPVKKPAAKRTRKAAVKVSVVVQAAGKELTEAEIYERVTEDWCKAGNKKADLKELAVYVKPEESAIYYVVNGSETGKVEF